MKSIQLNKSYQGSVFFQKNKDGQIEIRTRVYDRETGSQSITIATLPHGVLKVTKNCIVAHFTFDTNKLTMTEIADLLYGEADSVADKLEQHVFDDSILAARSTLDINRTALEVD